MSKVKLRLAKQIKSRVGCRVGHTPIRGLAWVWPHLKAKAGGGRGTGEGSEFQGHEGTRTQSWRGGAGAILEGRLCQGGRRPCSHQRAWMETRREEQQDGAFIHLYSQSSAMLPFLPTSCPSQDVAPILQTKSSYPNTLFIYFVAFIITCNDLLSSFLPF